MVGISRLPNETLLQVFENGCDSIFLQDLMTNRHRPQPVLFGSTGRRRKEFAEPLASVCKLWRSLVDDTPWFWVTEVVLTVHTAKNFSDREQQMIQQSSQSDLDVRVSMLQPDALAVELLRKHLLPLAPRWRFFTASVLTVAHVHLICQELNAFDALPRFVGLHLSARVPGSLVDLRANCPKLASVRLNNIPWGNYHFPFSGLTFLELSEGHNPPAHRRSTKLALTPSWATLKQLDLQISSIPLHATDACDSLRLVLPLLNQLQLTCGSVSAALTLLGSLDLPTLKRFYLNTDDTADFPGDYNPAVTQAILLPHLARLSCGLRANDYHRFFATVHTPLLSSFCLSPRRNNTDPTLDSCAEPIFSFPQLESCYLSWWEYEGDDDPTVSAFYSHFDFSPVSKARLELGSIKLTQTVRFPNLSNLSTDRIAPLSFLDAPLLRKVTIEEPEHASWGAYEFERREDDLSTLVVEELHIQPSNNTILHLSVIARPFMNLCTICLDFRTLRSESYLKVIAILLSAAAVTDETMPNMHSLRVVFSEDTEYADLVLIQSLKAFVIQRQDACHPLRSLHMTATPANKVDFAWFEERVPDFSKFVFEDDKFRIRWV